MKRKFCVRITAISIIMLCCIFLFISTSFAALINGGFETGDFSGWTVGGVNGGSGVAVDGAAIPGVTYSGFLPSLVNVRSGEYAAYGVAASTYSEYLSLSQQVVFLPGLCEVGFYMGHDEQGEFGIDSAIQDGELAIFINGSHFEFTTRYPANNFPIGSNPSDMYKFSTLFDSIGGTAALEFRFSGSGGARAGFSVDDIFATNTTSSAPVPEPSTILLLGFGLAGLAGVARKKMKK